jgi:hypothetical protein
MDKSFLKDFRDVKQQRWLADYSHEYLDSTICNECISKTERFVKEIKMHT